MSTPLQIYKDLYSITKSKLKEAYPNESEDKLSRQANMFAVKNTWNFYINPSRYHQYIGAYNDSSKTNWGN